MIDKIGNFSITTFQPQKQSFLDKLHTYTKNSADMNDTIIVPRTIFKGYLGVMIGTTLVTLAGVFNKYPPKSKTLMTTGLLASLYGNIYYKKSQLDRASSAR